jgi:hypothetical protein
MFVKSMLLIAAAAMAAQAQEQARTQIPSGTPVQVRLGQTISSKTAKSGDPWIGTLSADLAADGRVIALKGAPVKGIVVSANPSGRLSSPGDVALQLTSVTIEGAEVNVVTSTVDQKGGSHKKRNAALIGGGAVLGTIIGAAAGGGTGAAVGAASGAGAGTAGAAATGKKDVAFPVESMLTFTVK